MFTRRRTASKMPLASLLIAGLVVSAASVPANAQGIFDFFFSSPRRQGPPPSASAYSDPFQGFHNLFGRRGDEDRRAAPSAGSAVYCVRLCDGRFFPIQRTSGANPAQLCNSFCPASQTKIFSGGTIDQAVASDGSRYASLRNAFAYRERIVDNCTCNGRDAFGVVTPTVANDPTLRSGDIVATNEGFVAYTGGGRRSAEFVPINSHPGVPAEWRQRLSHTRIVPNATPVSADAIRDSAAALQSDRDRRVQLDR